MPRTSEKNITKEVSNKTLDSVDCNQINPSGDNSFYPIFYDNYDTLNTKEEFLPIVYYLEQIQSTTIGFIRQFVNLLNSDEEKFSLAYNIEVYDKKNCEPLQVYPYDFLRNIYLQINEAINNKETLIIKKEKIFEITYEFLKGYLPIFENDINEFEIQIYHNIDFTKTVKFFGNDKYEVEMLVYKFLGSLKEIISAINYEPVNKKINSINKEDVLRHLNEVRYLMQCKWRNKYLEEGEKDEPCAENYHARVEGKNGEITTLIGGENDQEDVSPLFKTADVQEKSTSLIAAKIDHNSFFSSNENINFIGSEDITQVSHNNNIIFNLGCLTLFGAAIFLIIYVYRSLKKRREIKEFERKINLYETP